jgi:two-component system, NarL family, nitrate/nitrite response regulator NarL
MDVLILTSVSMLGELLERCFAEQNDIKVTKWVADFERLRTAVKGLAVTRTSPDGKPASILVLIDVTQGVDIDEVRQLAIDYPRVILLALGLKSQRQDVVRAGRAGFCALVSRDAGVATLIKAMRDAVAGRLSC